MNSLEFINLEIAITNTKYKEHLKFAQFELAIKDEKRLQTLQQIKAELEAWYICKKHSHINNYNSNNKIFDITIWLNTENCDFKSCASFEECLKVKKALEVKENVD